MRVRVWRPRRDDVAMRRTVRRLVRSQAPVVVLARPNDATTVRALTKASRPSMYVVHGLSAAQRALEPVPPVRLLIDAHPQSPRAAMNRARRLFWFVEQGGSYAVLCRSTVQAENLERLWRHLAAGSSRLPWRRRLLREFSRSIGSVERVHRLVVVGVESTTLLKVREGASDLLAGRTGVGVEVRAEIPARRFIPDRIVLDEGAVPRHAPVEVYEVPRVQVRHYQGVVTAHEGMVLSSRSTVFPESFKWFQHESAQNNRLRDITPSFVRLRDSESTPPLLRGSYYYFEYKNSGHYGHLLTEGLAKLWGWETARAENPDLKLLIRRHRRDRGRDIERPDVALLRAYGVALDDIVWAEQSVRVDDLWTATPMLHNKDPYWIHPDLITVWDRIRDGLLVQSSDNDAHRRIFVTRHAGHRLCRNYPAVERLFEEHGFRIVDPSSHSLAAQARLFNDADVIAGFGGTGMFNLIHGRAGQRAIVLNHTAYDAKNEQLITAARGIDLQQFWSAPDLAQPQDGFDYDAFQSSWAFDFDALGDHLTTTLGDLTP